MSLLARLNHSASPVKMPLHQRLNQPFTRHVPVHPTAFRLQLARRPHTTPLLHRLRSGIPMTRHD